MITYAVILLVICVAVTIVCCTSFLRHTDPVLLFILFAFFAASELAFGLMVAAFFNNAKIAGIVAPLAHFACLLPRYIFFRVEAPQVGCLLFSRPFLQCRSHAFRQKVLAGRPMHKSGLSCDCADACLKLNRKHMVR